MQQDIIRKIIEMDKEARRLTAEAQQRKEDSARAAAAKRAEVDAEYRAMVRRRVEVVREAERSELGAQLKASNEQIAAAELALEKKYEQSRERWVRELVNRVLLGSGDDEF